jgi:hypothetical protein
MKFVFLNPYHHKNLDAIKRMCSKTGIELEITNDFNRCQENNYDILISNMHFFNPDLIPENIKIIFGPEFFPKNEIIGNVNQLFFKRCVYNSPSKWVEKYILDTSKSLVVPISQFPFAVDTEKFSPKNEKKEYDCLIYFKNRSPEVLSKIHEILDQKNLSYKDIIYGSYQEKEYMKVLHECKFMISINAHESQGFALQEAMSCNVPLLVYDIKTVYDVYNYTFFDKYKPLELNATTVPYWSEECGLKTTELNEIPELLDEMLNKYQTFNPRKYILETLTEEKCMQRILRYFNISK